MTSIYQQVFDKVKTDLNSSTYYNPLVTKTAPQQMATFPVVEVVEYNNIFQEETLDKEEKKSKLIYTIKIYSQDNNQNISKIVISEKLVNAVNNIMENYFGMTRTACTRVPNLDSNVYSFLMRYECILDEENLIIYRGR